MPRSRLFQGLGTLTISNMGFYWYRSIFCDSENPEIKMRNLASIKFQFLASGGAEGATDVTEVDLDGAIDKLKLEGMKIIP